MAYTVWVFFNFDWVPATGAFWLLAGTAWSAVRSFEVEQPGASPAAPAVAPAPWRSGAAIVVALVPVGLGALPLLADTWYLQRRAELAVPVHPLPARYPRPLGQGLVPRGAR